MRNLIAALAALALLTPVYAFAQTSAGRGYFPPTAQCDPRNGCYQEYNEFAGFLNSTVLGDWTSTVSGTGAAVSQPAASSTSLRHPGLIRLATGSTTTGRATWRTSANPYSLGQEEVLDEWMVYIPTLSNATDRYSFFVGFNSNETGGISGGTWFTQYLEGTSANWICRMSRTGGTSDQVTSTVAVTTGWHKITMQKTSSSTPLLTHWVDGVQVCQFTAQATSVPGEVGTDTLDHIALIIKSLGTASSTIDLDYEYLRILFKNGRG